MSNLLKECVADAKAIRETAIANAKAVLEEQFNSGITKVLANKLREETEAEDTVTVPSANDGVDSTTPVDTPKDENPDTGAPEAENITVTAKDASGTPLAVNGVPPKEIDAAGATDVPATTDASDTPLENDGESDELDSNELDEILKQLGAEDRLVNTESTDSAIDTNEVNTIPNVEDNYVKDTSAVPAEDNISLDDILKEIDSELNAEVAECRDSNKCDNDVTTEEIAEALVIAHKQNQELKKQLQEYKNAFVNINESLAETKLLNAKLLYTNKLFKCKNLSESQKLKVINTFDLAKTDREVKLAYTVLAESLNISGSSVVKTKPNTTVSSITEGLASKPVGSTKPSGEVIKESSDNKVAQRLQELAGIKVLKG